jgi:penicillin-binding protein 1C
MSDPQNNSEEDTRSRFRRLLSEFEEADQTANQENGTQRPVPDKQQDANGEVTLPLDTQADEKTPTETSNSLDETLELKGEDRPLDEQPTQPLVEQQPSQADQKSSLEEMETVPIETEEISDTKPTHAVGAGAAGLALTEPPVGKDDTQPTASAKAVTLKNQPVSNSTASTSARPGSSYTASSGSARPRSYRPATAPYHTSPTQTQSGQTQPPTYVPPRGVQQRTGGRIIDWRTSLGCLLRMTIMGIFGLVLIAIVAISIGVYQYYRIASTLPNVESLRDKAAKFETTRIYDRNGNVLYEVLDPNAGRRTYETLDKISPYMVAATVSTEDQEFYSHPGFNPLSILRAFLQNYSSGEVVSGASTITQQLARNLLFTPEERNQISYQRKIREAILATEITRLYSKSEILELYLNENNYGNLAYGVEAAAETYFGTTADKLTLAQAAFLAGLPQAPYVYDVYTNRDVTLARTEQVLSLIVQTSQEQGCIFVSNNMQPVCIDVVQAVEAANEIKSYEFKSPDIPIRYPHWVNYIRNQLETMYDPQTIYQSGFSVYTTLDPGLQDAAEQVVADQISQLKDNRASDGALVVIRPATGEVLAMVGSADFYNDEIDGQVNMAVSPRQPGSSIKPLTYLAAFETGWTPSTLIWDVPSQFPPSGDPNDTRPPYEPVNYDRRFHGPVTVRTALSNSYNVPAVKTLQHIGVYDDPAQEGGQGLVAMAERMGITTLTRNDYGLALTLGGGDVSLLELTGAYATLANGGRQVPPFSITRIVDHVGNVVYDHQPVLGEQVVRAEHAYLISDILSDNEARAPSFGRNSVLNLPFQVAAKTGTTNDFRDNWTLGYTPDVAVGVWVGNADYTPMQNTTGLTGAAPIWAQMMQIAVQQLTGDNPTPFSRPVGVVDRVICAVSGTEPSKWCPEQKTEIFAADQPPLPAEDDLWKEVVVDTWTGLSASKECPDFTDKAFVLNVTDPWAIKWIENDPAGQDWASSMGFDDPVKFVPARECKASDPRPVLEISAPRNGDRITSSPVDIYARIGATGNFRRYWLEFGLGENPVKWELIDRSGREHAQPEKIWSWDVSEIPPGPVTLRVRIESNDSTFAETRLLLNMQVPTPTPTPTSTFTPTPTFTPTMTPTNTPLPTATPTITLTPTETQTPTITPTPSETLVPTSSPTPP